MDFIIYLKITSKVSDLWSTGVAQSVKELTLGFSSGQDFKVCESETCVEFYFDSVEPGWDSLPLSLSLSLSLSAPLPPTLSLSNK